MLKQKGHTSCCEGRFFVPKAELPVEGTLRLLLDLSVGVGKAKLNLTGATFDVQGHPAIYEVEWKLRKRGIESGIDDLDLTVSAFPDLGHFGSDLEKIAQMLADGVQELVVEAGA
jgi:hypothetical protein